MFVTALDFLSDVTCNYIDTTVYTRVICYADDDARQTLLSWLQPLEKFLYYGGCFDLLRYAWSFVHGHVCVCNHSFCSQYWGKAKDPDDADM